MRRKKAKPYHSGIIVNTLHYRSCRSCRRTRRPKVTHTRAKIICKYTLDLASSIGQSHLSIFLAEGWGKVILSYHPCKPYNPPKKSFLMEWQFQTACIAPKMHFHSAWGACLGWSRPSRSGSFACESVSLRLRTRLSVRRLFWIYRRRLILFWSSGNFW